jgi:predicted unusual protein kinase regulating ubiquinone biosynthesis (AarF/ABC1/UbiB family)
MEVCVLFIHLSTLPYPRLGLAASLGYGAASEFLRRTSSSGTEEPSSLMMNEANVKRLVNKLSRMRGAALKLGQFMSIQGIFIHPVLWATFDTYSCLLRYARSTPRYK